MSDHKTTPFERQRATLEEYELSDEFAGHADKFAAIAAALVQSRRRRNEAVALVRELLKFGAPSWLAAKAKQFLEDAK